MRLFYRFPVLHKPIFCDRFASGLTRGLLDEVNHCVEWKVWKKRFLPLDFIPPIQLMKIRQRKRFLYNLFSQFLSDLAKVRANNRVVLSMRDSLMLLDLIENPPPRNAKFIGAMKEYQSRKVPGSDTQFRWP